MDLKDVPAETFLGHKGLGTSAPLSASRGVYVSFEATADARPQDEGWSVSQLICHPALDAGSSLF